MNILIAIGIILILIAIIVFEVFFICALKANKETEESITEEKPKKAELSEEQKKKQEKMRESFENLMGYGYEEALKSSKGE